MYASDIRLVTALSWCNMLYSRRCETLVSTEFDILDFCKCIYILILLVIKTVGIGLSSRLVLFLFVSSVHRNVYLFCNYLDSLRKRHSETSTLVSTFFCPPFFV